MNGFKLAFGTKFLSIFLLNQMAAIWIIILRCPEILLKLAVKAAQQWVAVCARVRVRGEGSFEWNRVSEKKAEDAIALSSSAFVKLSFIIFNSFCNQRFIFYSFVWSEVNFSTSFLKQSRMFFKSLILRFWLSCHLRTFHS